MGCWSRLKHDAHSSKARLLETQALCNPLSNHTSFVERWPAARTDRPCQAFAENPVLSKMLCPSSLHCKVGIDTRGLTTVHLNHVGARQCFTTRLTIGRETGTVISCPVLPDSLSQRCQLTANLVHLALQAQTSLSGISHTIYYMQFLSHSSHYACIILN